MFWNIPYAFSRPFGSAGWKKHLVVLWDDSCSTAVQMGIITAPCRMLPRSAGYCWHHVETRRLQGWTGAGMRSHQLFFSQTEGTTKTKWQKTISSPPWKKNNPNQPKVAYAANLGSVQRITWVCPSLWTDLKLQQYPTEKNPGSIENT